MMNESKVGIIVEAQDRASKILKGVSSNATAMGKKMTSAGKTMTAGLTLPILAMGTAVVKVSMDFEKSMANVSTLVDTSVESMDDMKDAVKEIAKRTPVALADLTSALYDIRSAGIEASGAMEVLENSAMLAVAGLGTTKQATDILTSAINAFGLDASKSEQWADVFFKTVKAGKTTVAELAQGFGQVAPLASQLGVRFEDLMSITASMTTSGMKASVAYTQVRSALANMLKMSPDMTEAFASIGVKAEDLTGLLQEKGLTGVIKMLSDAVGGNKEQLAKMFTSVEGLNAVMMLLGDTGVNATKIQEGMTDGSIALIEAYEKQKETFNLLWQELKNNVNIALLELGTELMPMVRKGAEWLIEKIKILTEKWKTLSPETQKWFLIGLGILAILGPIALGISALAVVFSPLGLIIGGVILVVIGFIYYVKNVMEIIDTLANHWDEVWSGIKITFFEMTDPILKQFERIIEGAEVVGEFIGGIGKNIGKGFGNLVDLGKNIIGVDDAVITPQGQVIQPAEDDYIIATKNPMGNNFSFDFRGANITDKNTFMNDIKKSLSRDIKLAGQGI